MFSLCDGEFGIVMLVEELSRSSVSYLYKKFGGSSAISLEWLEELDRGIIGRSAEDKEIAKLLEERKVIYATVGVVGVSDFSKLVRLLKSLERYIPYARNGVECDFSKYFGMLGDLCYLENQKNQIEKQKE